MNAHPRRLSAQSLDPAPRSAGVLVIGVAAFVALGFVLVTTLGGIGVPPDGPAAFFDRGQTIAAGGQSLDLSKAVFIKGDLCPNESSLTGNSPVCTVIDSQVPISVIAIRTNGLQPPVFKVSVDAPAGTTAGWVAFNDLRN